MFSDGTLRLEVAKLSVSAFGKHRMKRPFADHDTFIQKPRKNTSYVIITRNM